MPVVSIVMISFAFLGALDRILGNRLGLGKEFEKGFLLLGQLVLSMMGMIIMAPVIADLLAPLFRFVYEVLHIEPSIIPASLFANDMGGAPLAAEIAQNKEVGMYNAMVVSSMMGATVSFTIPFALGCLKKEKHKELILGLLSGIVTVPIGCLVAGLVCRIRLGVLLLDLLPLLLFAALIAVGLLLFPKVCILIFRFLGIAIKVIVSIGLAHGMMELLLGKKLLDSAAPASEGAMICLNAAMVMAGAFPLLFVLSKLLSKPLLLLGRALGIDKTATLGFLSTLANNASTFEMMNEMNGKGIVLNAAFAVSASFVLADHLAFTLTYAPSYLLPMAIGKTVAGITAVVFAVFIYRKVGRTLSEGDA